MKNILIVLIIMTFVGCTSEKPGALILEQYNNTTIQLPIPEEQAKIIAQKELIDKLMQENFNVDNPILTRSLEGIKYQDEHWFVTFHEVERSSIPFIYIIAIEKKTGKIKFSDDIPPGKEWIVDAALYKR